eukprot:gb/GECG01005101.1/.p1 GENE.gb/GECG01005101.1/~~gb/GECG01005101.1/.p1  ORF type:complete len:712 (+),score=78.62 gb/GECG01005101.1/:1-2136(+)
MDLTSALETKGLEESRAYILEQTRADRAHNGEYSHSLFAGEAEEGKQNGELCQESLNAKTDSGSRAASGRTEVTNEDQGAPLRASPEVQDGNTNMTLADSIAVDLDPHVRGNCLCYDSGGNMIIRSLGNVIQVGFLDHFSEQFREMATCELPEEDSVRHLDCAKLPKHVCQRIHLRDVPSKRMDIDQQGQGDVKAGSVVTAATGTCIYVVLALLDSSAKAASLQIIQKLKQDDVLHGSYEDQVFPEEESQVQDSASQSFKSVFCCWSETARQLYLCIQQHSRLSLLSIDVVERSVRYLRVLHTSSLVQDFYVHCRNDRLEVILCFSKEVHTLSWELPSLRSHMYHRSLLTDSVETSNSTVGDAVLCTPIRLQKETFLLVITEAILDFSAVKSSLRGPGQSLNMAINESRRHTGDEHEANKGTLEHPGASINQSTVVSPQATPSSEDSAISQLFDIKGAQQREEERNRCRDARAIVLRLPSRESSFLSIESCVRLPFQIRHPKALSVFGNHVIVGDAKNVASVLLRTSERRPLFEKFAVSKLPNHCTLLGLGVGSKKPTHVVIQTKKSVRSPLFGVNLNNPAEDDETAILLWSLKLSTPEDSETAEEEAIRSDKHMSPSFFKSKCGYYGNVSRDDTSHLAKAEQLSMVHSLSSAASARAWAAEALCSACRSTSAETMDQAIDTAYRAVQNSESAWNEAKQVFQRTHGSDFPS